MGQKAEVCEGAGQFLVVLLKDLECPCYPSMPMDSMGYAQKHFCHGRGRGFEPVVPAIILRHLV